MSRIKISPIIPMGCPPRSSQTFALAKYHCGEASKKNLDLTSDPQLCLVMDSATGHQVHFPLTIRIVLRSKTLETIRVGDLVEACARYVRESQIANYRKEDLPIFAVAKHHALAMQYRDGPGEAWKMQVSFQNLSDRITVTNKLQSIQMHVEDRSNNPRPATSPGQINTSPVLSSPSSKGANETRPSTAVAATSSPGIRFSGGYPSPGQVAPGVESSTVSPGTSSTTLDLTSPGGRSPTLSVYKQYMPPRRELPPGFPAPAMIETDEAPKPPAPGMTTRSRSKTTRGKSKTTTQLKASTVRIPPAQATLPATRRGLDLANIPKLSPAAPTISRTPITNSMDQLNSVDRQDSLKQYAAQTDEDRQAALDAFLAENLDNPNFIQLCMDMDRGWRGTVFSDITNK